MSVTPYLLAPLLTWFVIQLIKFSISLVKGEANIRYLFASGGMPSAHSGIVCALTTIALIEQGVNSPLFGITAILAAIVVYDSFGVRRSAGDIARTLNKLIDDLENDTNVKNVQNYAKLHEILGHKPLEVFVGAMLGVIIAAIFEFKKAYPYVSFLFNRPTKAEIIILALSGAALVIGSLIYAKIIKAKAKEIAAYKKFRKQVLGLGSFGGLIFLILGFAQYQNALYLNMRVFSYTTALIWLTIASTICIPTVKILSDAQRQVEIEDRKTKWLKKAGKKK
ncbi:MAG: divergent PAP2 family protein [bacterium]|nr:divergent PAP2 family protein [bacterium]